MKYASALRTIKIDYRALSAPTHLGVQRKEACLGRLPNIIQCLLSMVRRTIPGQRFCILGVSDFFFGKIKAGGLVIGKRKRCGCALLKGQLHVPVVAGVVIRIVRVVHGKKIQNAQSAIFVFMLIIMLYQRTYLKQLGYGCLHPHDTSKQQYGDITRQQCKDIPYYQTQGYEPVSFSKSRYLPVAVG